MIATANDGYETGNATLFKVAIGIDSQRTTRVALTNASATVVPTGTNVIVVVDNSIGPFFFALLRTNDIDEGLVEDIRVGICC